MQTVFVKLLHRSGETSATEVDVPARIIRIEDADEQYRALADYINAEYDTDTDPIVEVIDARAY